MEPEDCPNIHTLTESAERRELSCCRECPRNSKEDYPVFAAGCDIHQTPSPTILFVFRDPSSHPPDSRKKGCSWDGKVCPWCHTDGTAINFQKLYHLIDGTEPNAEKRHPVYCINAVLHGAKKNERPKAGSKKACSAVLRRYVELLNPKLTVALGRDAEKGLGYAFPVFGERFESKNTALPVIVDGRAFWSTFHPSPQVCKPHLREQREESFKQIGYFVGALRV